MAFDKQFLINEYSKYYRKAVKCSGKNDKKALAYIKYIATIAWYYPILYNFIDEDVESLLNCIARRILPDKLQFDTSDEERIVFYNGQIIDCGALTEQYLDYFINKKYKVLFIVSCYNYTSSGKNILARISKNPNIEVFISNSKNDIERISDVYNKIKTFKPNKAFLHFLPNDVLGFCVFSQLEYLKRYYIVHNDHTFWLGKLCSDYFIEFRNFGYQLAIQRREISEDKLLLLPYYPIKRDYDFEGFPFDRKNKIIGFSAASLYKYLLDPDLLYFKVIKRLLIENDNFIFCLAGVGTAFDENTIKSFIVNENLQGRFIYLGMRKDFYQLVGNVDILFESYPLKGGLTPLFAINQNIPIVGISCTHDFSGTTEDFFGVRGYKSPRNFDEFYKEATKLIIDEHYRKIVVELVSKNRYNKESFNQGLEQIIDGDKFCSIDKEYLFNLDDDKMLSDYMKLDSEHFFLLQFKYNTLLPLGIKQLYYLSLLLRYHGIKYTVKLFVKRICRHFK